MIDALIITTDKVTNKVTSIGDCERGRIKRNLKLETSSATTA